MRRTLSLIALLSVLTVATPTPKPDALAERNYERLADVAAPRSLPGWGKRRATMVEYASADDAAPNSEHDWGKRGADEVDAAKVSLLKSTSWDNKRRASMVEYASPGAANPEIKHDWGARSSVDAKVDPDVSLLSSNDWDRRGFITVDSIGQGEGGPNSVPDWDNKRRATMVEYASADDDVPEDQNDLVKRGFITVDSTPPGGGATTDGQSWGKRGFITVDLTNPAGAAPVAQGSEWARLQPHDGRRRENDWHKAAPPADEALEKRTDDAQGFDTGYNPDVDWSSIAASKSFAYILATESIGNMSPSFSSHYQATHDAGLIRGAYHVGRLYGSSGAEQANYFLANGGYWTTGTETLPGALWLEFASSRDSCYGFTAAQSVAWIQDFSNTYLAATGHRPLIRTHAAFWTTCVGNSNAFSSTHDLWFAQEGSGTGSPGTLPGGWSSYKIWQYENLGISPIGATLGNLDVFNGDESAVASYAN